MKTEQIKTLDELKKMAGGNSAVSCHIALNGGLKSSKCIEFNSGVWDIFNLVDNTLCKYNNDKELEEETNIVKAINKGALYAEV